MATGDIFETIKAYLAQHYELISLFTALFFVFWLYGVWKEQNWVYKNRMAVQSGIDMLPLKVQKWIWFIFGIFWLTVSLFITFYLYFNK